MGRKYLSVIDARTKKSKCTFQTPTVPLPRIPAIPSLPPLPSLPSMPTINRYCPFDDADEVVPTS